MKKASMETLVRMLKGEKVEGLEAIRAEMETELAKNAAKADANRAVYAQVKGIVFDELSKATAPVPVSELYKAVAEQLPSTFSQSKLSYALTHTWASDVIKTNDGKVNTYMVRG